MFDYLADLVEALEADPRDLALVGELLIRVRHAEEYSWVAQPRTAYEQIAEDFGLTYEYTQEAREAYFRAKGVLN